jgi:hypothetical protein
MKKFFIILFIAAATAATAQTISFKKIGVTYSVDQQFLPGNIRSDGFDMYSGIEKGRNNFTAGVTTEVSFTKLLALRTGLLYSNRDYTGKFSCYSCYYEQNIDPFRERETIKQRYLDVPLIARFYVLPGRFSLYADAGLIGNFLIENGTEVYQHDLNKVESNDIILSGEAGVGVSYLLNRKIEVSLTAAWRNSLTEYHPKDDMQLRSLGVIAGLAYRLKQ